jgi:endoglucanase
MIRPTFLAALALLTCMAGAAQAATKHTGVNLAGAEFGDGALPGTHGMDYIYPSKAEVDQFLARGLGTIRLPFRWERLQPNLSGPSAAAEQARLDDLVKYITGKGGYVILDPHNYARYRGATVGSAQVPVKHFGNFWKRLATQYRGNGRVILGLMNEPHDMPTEQWLTAANAAIAAIRKAKAKNLVLVPGNAWTGAHS